MSCARYGYIPSSLLRLVRATGIFPLPFYDWFALRCAAKQRRSRNTIVTCRWVYALFPHAIGSGAGYMLSSLVRLVPAPGICSLPSCDWFKSVRLTPLGNFPTPLEKPENPFPRLSKRREGVKGALRPKSVRLS